MPEDKRLLKVFLSYASQDKPVVQELSRRLIGEGWIDAWLDVKKLLPGQDWRIMIEEAVESSDIVIICLSNNSVSKEGYVQKELRYAREIALEKPEETIFLIPLRLDECDVPRGLRFYQWVDYFGEKKDVSYSALIESLNLRYDQKLMIEDQERIRKEKIEREIAEKIAQEKAANEKAEREAAEKIAREKALLDAEEIARKKMEELERREKEAKKRKEAEERAKRDEEEKARQKAEDLFNRTNKAVQLEWAGDLKNALKIYYEIRNIDSTYPNVDKKINELEKEIHTRQELEREEVARKAANEEVERIIRETNEKAVRDKAKRDAVEKAEREKAQRRATQKALRAQTLSNLFVKLKSVFSKATPIIKFLGIIGILTALIWVGSWTVPKLISFIPAPRATITQQPIVQITSTISPVPLTETLMPSATPTATLAPTLVMPTATIFTPIPLPYPKEIIDGQGVHMRVVPEGVFTMGSDSGIENEKPVHAVYLDAYYIDRFEVTNKLYKVCVDAGDCKPPKYLTLSSRTDYYGNPENDNYPVI